MINTIFLDMDGVTCDWWKAALQVLGHAPIDRFTLNKELPFWIEDHIGSTQMAVKEAIDAMGHEWWQNLEDLPWFDDLLGTLTDFHPRIIFLSSSGWFHSAAMGKMGWLRNRFGVNFEDYVFTKHKELCAAPDRILIDDSPDNVEKFTAAGGKAILFPQAWNHLWQVTDPVSHVRRELHQLIIADRYDFTAQDHDKIFRHRRDLHPLAKLYIEHSDITKRVAISKATATHNALKADFQ